MIIVGVVLVNDDDDRLTLPRRFWLPCRESTGWSVVPREHHYLLSVVVLQMSAA